MQYLTQVLRDRDWAGFYKLSQITTKMAPEPGGISVLAGQQGALADDEERVCAAVMDACLERLRQEGRLELLAALLSGDQHTFETFRCEAPELVHLPQATYEWYCRNYLDRDYPFRMLLRCNGVTFPTGRRHKGMEYCILVVNPGSTSTKIAVFQGEKAFAEKPSATAGGGASLWSHHELAPFRLRCVEEALAGFDLTRLDAVCARGGMLPACPSRAFAVHQDMIDYLSAITQGAHASNLGCVMAGAWRSRCTSRPMYTTPWRWTRCRLWLGSPAFPSCPGG